MKIRLLSLLALLTLVGCKEIPGQMVVHHEFKAQTRGGLFSRPRDITIPAGHYNPILRAEAFGNDLSVEITLNGKKEKIPMQIPRKAIPEENGSFRIASGELKQPFHVSGEIQTSYVNGPEQRGIESCTYPVRERVCWRNSEGYTSCEYQTTYETGRQHVEFYYRHRTTLVSFELATAQQPGQAAATFKGVDKGSSKIYLFQGRCDSYWRF